MSQITVTLTDIVADKESDGGSAGSVWSSQAEAMVRAIIGEQTASGFLLRHCTHRSPRVHGSNFCALFSREGASIASPHHNPSHLVAAWHMLLRHPTAAASASLMEDDSTTSTTSAPAPPSSSSSSSTALLPTVSTTPAAAISIIHQAMAAKSKLFAGSDHLLDDVDPEGGPRRTTSARYRYASSVSLAFGELTKDSSWKVLDALAMTSSSRLLDVGSAFGRFCVHAVLAAPGGASVTGIEVGIKRAQLASRFLDELTVEHNSTISPVRSNIRLVQGDILDHLAELFAHSHVFLFDARSVESTWRILAHLLSYLSGVENQLVVSCKPLDTCDHDLIVGGRCR